MTLRSFSHKLTNPIVPHKDEFGNPVLLDSEGKIMLYPDGTKCAPERLIHGMEKCHWKGPENSDQWTITFTKANANLAVATIRILPALCLLFLGQIPPKWFHARAERIGEQVTFEMDEDTKQFTGKWTTKADEEMKALVLQRSHGLPQIQLENLELLASQPIRMVLDRPSDHMSAGTSVGSSPGLFNAISGRPTLDEESSGGSDISSLASQDSDADDDSSNNSEDTTAQRQLASEAVGVHGSADHDSVAGVTAI
jgi:hypothetical protein